MYTEKTIMVESIRCTYFVKKILVKQKYNFLWRIYYMELII